MNVVKDDQTYIQDTGIEMTPSKEDWEKMKALADLLKSQEELHPDLKRYLVKTEGGIQQIKHPLSFVLMYVPELNGMYNQRLIERQKAVADAKAKGEWGRYVFLHERPYRLDAFNEIKDQANDTEYWEILGHCWTDSDNLYQFGDLVPSLLNSKRPGRENMMDEKERAFLNSLPEQLVVYRGHRGKNKKGWSWSLSAWKARWFAAREDVKTQFVVYGHVAKQDVIATFLSRQEFECVIDPNKVKNIKPFNPTWELKYYSSIALEGANPMLSHGFSYHGLWHWWKVDYNVQQLCKLVKDADVDVCRAFAYLHDCRRINENKDPHHGGRAAAYVTELAQAGRLSVLSSDQISKLITAIRDHEEGKVSDDPTIGVCWDADRLDLVRVGIAPDKALLSTAAAKDLVWRI